MEAILTSPVQVGARLTLGRCGAAIGDWLGTLPLGPLAPLYSHGREYFLIKGILVHLHPYRVYKYRPLAIRLGERCFLLSTYLVLSPYLFVEDILFHQQHIVCGVVIIEVLLR